MTFVLLSTQGIPAAAMPNYYACAVVLEMRMNPLILLQLNVGDLNYKALSGGHQFEFD